MLSFTSSQMVEMSTVASCSALARHWREVFAGRTLDRAGVTVEALARSCIEEARQSGIVSREDITLYGDLCIASGTGFARPVAVERSAP